MNPDDTRLPPSQTHLTPSASGTPARGVPEYRSRILVVEDSATQAAALAALLAGNGFEPIVVHSGEEALDAVPGGAFDLVLTDIVMPGINGHDVCRAVKAMPGGTEIPVVLLTGLSDPMDIVRGLECGADNYITKPYSDEHLLTRVKQVLSTREIRRGSRRGGAVDITFLGERFTITAGKEQILDLLVASYEELVRTNEQVRSAARRARFLAEAGSIAAASLDAEEILRSIGDLVVPSLGDVCTANLVGRDGQLYRVHVGFVDSRFEAAATRLLAQPPGALARTASAWAITERRRLVQMNAREADPETLWGDGGQPIGELLNPRAVVSIPLLARGNALGALTLAVCGRRRRWADEDLALLDDLARQTALAVDNARLYEDAQLATRARDDVLAVVSHDLRNPVHAISMASSFVLELLPDDPGDTRVARSQVETIQRAANRATALIRDLLDITRLESGLLAITPSPCSPEAIVTDAVAETVPLAKEKGLRLDVDLAPGLPELKVDRTRIGQVLSNLLGNAIKFTPSGGSVRLECSSNGTEVHFTVTDTGPGIPADSIAHVFDRFWQARETQTLGTGLGLFISKGLVEAHGGRIWLESEDGRGAKFGFAIPV